MRLLLLLLLSFPIVAYAASNLTGTWNVKLDYQGQGGDATLVLKQDGGKITGDYSGARGDADVTGTIDGRTVELELDLTGAIVYYHGKLSADGTKIEGAYDFGGQRAGTFVATKAANP